MILTNSDRTEAIEIVCSKALFDPLNISESGPLIGMNTRKAATFIEFNTQDCKKVPVPLSEESFWHFRASAVKELGLYMKCDYLQKSLLCNYPSMYQSVEQYETLAQ